jgi:hypothetical protein
MSDQSRIPDTQATLLWEAEQRDAIESVMRRMRADGQLNASEPEVRRLIRASILRQRQAFRVFFALMLSPVDLTALDNACEPLRRTEDSGPDAPAAP